jgi:hypothetical protein
MGRSRASRCPSAIFRTMDVKMTGGHVTVTEQETDVLRRSGGWKTNTDVGKEIGRCCAELRAEWKTWSTLGGSIGVRADKRYSLEETVRAFNEIQHEHLTRNAETRMLPPPGYDAGLVAVRVHPFVIYRVRKTLQSATMDANSRTLALSTNSPFPYSCGGMGRSDAHATLSKDCRRILTTIRHNRARSF